MNPEPLLIAYRVDLKSKKEFYNIQEAADFFKISKANVTNRAAGHNGGHITGTRINQRWNLFRTEMQTSYVQQIINENKHLKLNFK